MEGGQRKTKEIGLERKSFQVIVGLGKAIEIAEKDREKFLQCTQLLSEKFINDLEVLYSPGCYTQLII